MPKNNVVNDLPEDAFEEFETSDSTTSHPPEPLTKSSVTDALTLVFDPELEIDIVTLGLVYGVDIGDKKDVLVTMTMTTAGCPFAGQIVKDVEDAVNDLGAHSVEVKVVFDPPWKPTPELRAMLGV